MASIRRIGLTREILDVAAMWHPAHLRSLDAIHLASAITVFDRLTAFVSYDSRLLSAAAAAGLPVVSPN